MDTGDDADKALSPVLFTIQSHSQKESCKAAILRMALNSRELAV